MTADIRNQWGFPIITRFEWARKYAEEAKQRNKPKCDCESCREKELLPAVMQITQNWANAASK